MGNAFIHDSEERWSYSTINCRSKGTQQKDKEETLSHSQDPGTIAKVAEVQIWNYLGPQHGILPHRTVT